ncbi:exopolyphosphatase [Planctobacterium marinum]|uniref:Exopolyphosphatase n=1 Tax=Planctobacterium marinum TaxID=1631968 RepID=A0AA48KQQ8_9ALTE|nr:exopolyphosphatase [Planctobacterium marinum]
MTDLEDALAGVDSREVTPVAALDIGSNSFHLVVARIMAGSVQILHRVKQKVRLADGLDDDGMLSKEAIERGMAALEECKESMLGFKPEKVRIVATYTLRKAINSGEFISAAKKILPYPVEVISGVEEARLIYQGVAHTNAASGNRLVVDIGGGSTEFIVGEGFDPLLMRSLSMGCVNFTQRFFADEELKEKAFQKAITAAHQELELISDKYRAMGWDVCIGTSGTIKTLANVCAELEGRSEPAKITKDNLKQLIKHCCEAGKVSKLNLSAITEDRLPVFAAGLAVLMAVFESLDITEMEYSSAALREGVLYEMEDRLMHHDIRQRTAESIATRYDVDIHQARRVLQTTSSLLQQVADDWQLQEPELQSILGWAALLHEVGLQINSRRVQHHSAYILTHADLPGFNQEQQSLLATLVACHRKKFNADDIPKFEQFQREHVYALISLLRIGVLLNIKRQDNLLPEMNAKVDDDKLHLIFADSWLENKPLIEADLGVEAGRQESLGITLSFA